MLREFSDFVSEYHQAFKFTPLLDHPVECRGRILFGNDTQHKKAAIFDVDLTLTAFGKPTLSENYYNFLGEENLAVKREKKNLKRVDKKIDLYPEDADKNFKEYMTILASCNIHYNEHIRACKKAAEKTIPVKGGREAISYLEKMGYGIFAISAAPEDAVKMFGRQKYGIPEDQVVGTPFKFKNNYLTDESYFVYGRNKPVEANKLLLKYNCLPVLVITDLAFEGKVFVESGLEFALIASEKREEYPKKIYFKPEMRKNLMLAVPPILAQERAVYIAENFTPTEILNISRLSRDAVIKGEELLRKKKISEEDKNEFILCLKKLFSIEGLPFPIKKYNVIDKMLELKASSEYEECKKIIRNLLEGIDKYLVEMKLWETTYLEELQRFIS